MKIKIVILLFSIFAVMLISSCGSNVSKRLPQGNAKDINTKENDFAPINIPASAELKSPCDSEFDASTVSQRDNVRPSAEYLAEMFGKQIGERIELISFINNRHGILAVPHPPDSISASLKNIPFHGITGGTDLFEFKYENDDFTFKNLGSPINSKTWDSHPFVAANEKGKILLVWSSDRSDNFGGMSSPIDQ